LYGNLRSNLAIINVKSVVRYVIVKIETVIISISK